MLCHPAKFTGLDYAGHFEGSVYQLFANNDLFIPSFLLAFLDILMSSKSFRVLPEFRYCSRNLGYKGKEEGEKNKEEKEGGEAEKRKRRGDGEGKRRGKVLETYRVLCFVEQQLGIIVKFMCQLDECMVPGCGQR